MSPFRGVPGGTGRGTLGRMPELMLPQLIERAATTADGSLSGVMRTLIAAPDTDAERAGERLCVFGAPLPAALAARRYRVIGERSGREYLRFTLALEDGPESLLEPSPNR